MDRERRNHEQKNYNSHVPAYGSSATIGMTLAINDNTGTEWQSLRKHTDGFVHSLSTPLMLLPTSLHCSSFAFPFCVGLSHIHHPLLNSSSFESVGSSGSFMS